MESIGRHLTEIAHSIKIRGADLATRGGFTQVPNFVLKSTGISPGAKLAYSMLLHYAWQNDYCFPGQDRLATDMGVAKRSVVTYMQELETAGFVVVERRGQGKSNMYELIMKLARRKI